MGDMSLTQTCNRRPLKLPISIGEKGAGTYFSEGLNLSVLTGSVKDRGSGKGKPTRTNKANCQSGALLP